MMKCAFTFNRRGGVKGCSLTLGQDLSSAAAAAAAAAASTPGLTGDRVWLKRIDLISQMSRGAEHSTASSRRRTRRDWRCVFIRPAPTKAAGRGSFFIIESVVDCIFCSTLSST